MNQEKRRALANRAMPEVKKLVKKFDKAAIQNCLNQLRNYDTKVKMLAEAEKEVEKLKKQVN